MKKKNLLCSTSKDARHNEINIKITASEETTKYESTKRNKMAHMKEQNGEDCEKVAKIILKS